jgi:hypothetical protein
MSFLIQSRQRVNVMAHKCLDGSGRWRQRLTRRSTRASRVRGFARAPGRRLACFVSQHGAVLCA